VRSFKILVVDDFEPFRRFILSVLERRAEYQLIGQASDGLEAVQLAEQLQPDLVVLDVGLPKLNGIEAAKRIRQVAPLSKVLFLSQESSPEVVEEAFRIGGMGYVVKTRAQGELMRGIEAVLAGRHFASGDLEMRAFTETNQASAPHHHEALFYSDDAILIQGFAGFTAAALKLGNPAIVMATKSHQESLVQKLKSEGLDLEDAIQQGTYIPLDATEMLSRIMRNGSIDRIRFLEVLTRLMEPARKAAKAVRPRIAICGEIVTLLWAIGNSDVALLLEKSGNELSDAYEVDLLCAYPVQTRQDEAAFESICAEHSAVSLL
jgi:DNA-binding NarL/FixJ family response regulator